MPHSTTIARRKMREEEPEKYEEFRRQQRERDNMRNAEKRRRWAEEPHTRAQLMERQEELETKRAKDRERYHAKKASLKRSTRTSSATSVSSAMRQTPAKKPRDMSPDEYREYRANQKRVQRSQMSHQKKTALRLKRREKYRQERLEKLPLPAHDLVSTPEAAPSTSKRLRQSLYNASCDYRQTVKKLGASNEEYAKLALNLINARTPEKRAAIVEEQRRHPARTLFTSTYQDEPPLPNLEEELGITGSDNLEYGPAEEEIISKPLHNEIKLFYLGDEISRMLPHARYSSKHGAARVMVCTIKDAHTSFLDAGKGRVSRTLFQSLRPKNVRLMGSVALETCLCVYCTNVRLKIVTLNALLVGSGQIPAEKDMLNFLTCPFEGRWPGIQCIDGKCTQCSNRMRPFEIFCRDIIGTTGLKWDRWERNQAGKVEPMRKEGTLRELLKDLEKDVNEPTKGCSFLQHLFVAYWQYSQFKACRTNPDDGEVVMVQDFGENRKAAYCSEVKSAHFGKQQITVHPVVCFYRSGDTVVRDSLLFLSDDTTHDHHAVREFTLRTVDFLRSKLTIRRITMWSDGAASQYKGRGSFHDLTLLPYSPQRCFYGSEHGKGEADGETGILSQALRRATYQGENFSCAKDMVTYLSQQFSHERRHYILVDKIDRVEADDEVLTIPGTRKYHQFETIKPYVLRARRLACFCTACRENRPQQCVNREIVGTYDVHKCKPSADTVLNEAFVEAQPSSPQIESSDDQCPKVGSYVKLTCQIHKATKIFYATVISVDTKDNFSVRFLQKSGSKYSFGEQDDEGLITSGPPDFYKWKILDNTEWSMDHRGHYTFSV